MNSVRLHDVPQLNLTSPKTMHTDRRYIVFNTILCYTNLILLKKNIIFPAFMLTYVNLDECLLNH